MNDKSGECGGTENVILFDCMGHANIDMPGKIFIITRKFEHTRGFGFTVALSLVRSFNCFVEFCVS